MLDRPAAIRQLRTYGAKTLLKSDQSGGVKVGAPHIQYIGAARFGIPNDIAKKELRAAQGAVSLIGVAIFIDNGCFVPQNQQSCDGPAVFGRNPDGQPIPEALRQVPEPGKGLNRNSLAAAGHDLKFEKNPQVPFMAAHAFHKTFLLGAADLPLDAVFVKAGVDRFEGRMQIEHVHAIRCAGCKSGVAGGRERAAGPWAKLEELEVLFGDELMNSLHQLRGRGFRVKQRLAVIGKGERDQPPAGKPTVDTTEDNAVRQGGSRGRCRDSEGLEVIGAPQGFQPADGVKDRTLGMSVDERGPPGIQGWIEPINSHKK